MDDVRGCNGEMAKIFLCFDSYENEGMDRVSLDQDGAKKPKSHFFAGKRPEKVVLPVKCTQAPNLQC
jgi:hypothetical protein